jgi:hypothetical protein
LITAGVSCTLLFTGSHLWWQWRQRKGKKDLPLFWERPLIALALLFAASGLTTWDMQEFTIELLSFYLVFLGIHTVLMARRMRPSMPPVTGERRFPNGEH